MTAPESAELGTTTNPVDLIPGDSAGLRASATVLTGWSTRLSDTGDELKGLRAPSWTGEAADSFWESFGAVPSVWHQAADLLEKAATALNTHADVIDTAQTRAQTAIDMWQRGEDQTAAARAAYNTAVAQWNQNQSSNAGSSGSSPYGSGPYGSGGYGSSPYGAQPYPQFVDAGADERREAKEILEDARTSLDTSGDDTIMALTRAGGGTYSTSGSSTTDSEFSWSWGSVTSDQWKNQWGKNSWNGEEGTPSLGLAAVLASVNAGAWVWRGRSDFVTPAGGSNGEFYGEGSAEALSAGVTGSSSFSATQGLQAKIEAEANLAKAEGQIGYRNDYSDVHLAGSAQVGASGEGEATFSTDGVEVEGEVFAGARVGGDIEGSVGGIGITGGAEGWAGAGAGAGARFEFEDGKWHIGANAGLAWGLGGKASVGIVIDPAEIAETGEKLWDTMTGWW